MKKQTQLLSALALSVGLTLSAPFPAVASIPGQVPGQAALPSLAPMLEKVLPAVVSVRVEGTAAALGHGMRGQQYAPEVVRQRLPVATGRTVVAADVRAGFPGAHLRDHAVELRLDAGMQRMQVAVARHHQLDAPGGAHGVAAECGDVR